jgi:hypothetical protein
VGHGFTIARGNWDGAGITWGIVGFALRHGELSQIILKIFSDNPALVLEAFGGNAQELIDVMNSSRAVQMQFADSISQGTTKIMIRGTVAIGVQGVWEIRRGPSPAARAG